LESDEKPQDIVKETDIGGMVFYIVERIGANGYKKIYSFQEFELVPKESISWLH